MRNSTAEFENYMAIAALGLRGRTSKQGRKYRRFGTRGQPNAKDKIGNLGIFFGISVFTSVVFVAGLMPGTVDAPLLWTHAFIALTLAQFAMLAGATLKASSRRNDTDDAAGDETLALAMANVDATENTSSFSNDARPSLPPIALASGSLGEKTYVAFSDGSIEIDTMLGRRRFADLSAAREFVGA
ncbi:MAG: hypothetical protein IKE66_05160 [Hyphomicrobium sp.]|nr:hypothetical protein [Hyphomicrobium sp.]